MSQTTNAFPLASEKPYGTDAPVTNGNDEGASGDSSGNSVTLSTGGMIAIIVVLVLVIILGTSTATLFMIAKKREWTMRETIRKSARKVVTALTPRRSEFPSSVKESRRAKFNDVPPTPRVRPEDMEKGLAKAEAKRMEQGWGRL
ncbi:hypothetical protein B0T10DRAFT_246254 [Thelonectria olida]|uniref:Uncharacterized protein n=1 Tax=Thelonectria olida TaxID=1576542 RepID=A0A9P9ATE3_9HYPO|nr:hypothetical protein B0T10DRAFT_246254 [Thelonectria olida]